MSTKVTILLLFVLAISELSMAARVPLTVHEPAKGGGGGGTFDITKYGAKPGGADIAEAILCAWKEAVKATTPSTIMIPAGEWTLCQVKLEGPNKAPIEIVIKGTLKANPDPGALPDKKGNWITINNVCDLTICGGGVLDGQGMQAWKQNDCAKNSKCSQLPITLCLNFLNNTIIRDITSKDSKNFHVNLISSHNVTFDKFCIDAPEESLNTDGIHMGRSTMVNITNTQIKTGDDCISVGDDMCDLHICNVTCGPGHGISIGSLGKYENEKEVKSVFVKNCTFTGTQNGVRIKTWPAGPGTFCVSDIHFEDLIMNNVSNPVIIDQEYCPYNQCDKSKASSIQIDKVSVKNVKGTSFSCDAVILACSSAKPCTNIEIADVDLKFCGAVGPFTTRCSNVKPVLTGKQVPPICAGPAAGGPAKKSPS